MEYLGYIKLYQVITSYNYSEPSSNSLLSALSGLSTRAPHRSNTSIAFLPRRTQWGAEYIAGQEAAGNLVSQICDPKLTPIWVHSSPVSCLSSTPRGSGTVWGGPQKVPGPRGVESCQFTNEIWSQRGSHLGQTSAKPESPQPLAQHMYSAPTSSNARSSCKTVGLQLFPLCCAGRVYLGHLRHL